MNKSPENYIVNIFKVNLIEYNLVVFSVVLM